MDKEEMFRSEVKQKLSKNISEDYGKMKADLTPNLARTNLG